MTAQGLGLKNRLSYLGRRARGFDAASVLQRSREVGARFGKPTPVVFADMLWSAAFKNTAFQDYVDYDFAMLTATERETFMTHSLSNHIAMKYDQPEFRSLFHDKLEFNHKFADLLGRGWIDVRESSVDQIRDFVLAHEKVMGKVPFSDSGHGVERYEATDVVDWQKFRAQLLAKGQTLLEEYITQHPTLAAICPGTANTTRVTTFFDGTDTHVLSMAQKFGRGAASDQQTFGGFYTMLDLQGHSRGAGYDSHDNVYKTHPESGVSIVDFQLPMVDELFAFIDKAARVVPQIQYVGWDIVIGETGPVLVEGNWAAGVYENKPSVTGIRTGSRPRFREFVGF
ncbi:sugar-transfer associated ATP-grasp domain-containing protein [Lacisediminihabitans changchengi]|uniref:sugar-transfer associated ATP-grasp domain-containing protein n=1 Tax=Lacisediminihabitans changchengi TaxID=2787634 RepID=UPI0027DDC7A1|nr:sugar-transfer associated ATP-grasp domain-containing protein [Lacisediminihabitans changchengi]